MKTKSLFALALAGLALSSTAHAAVMSYTQTGYLTGSLGGTSFTKKAVTMRVTGETGSIVFAPINDGAIPVWQLAGSTTIDIAGFDTATFNGSDVFGAQSYNLSAFIPNTAAVGIFNLTSGNGILGVVHSTDLNYDLATEKTFSGNSAIGPGTYSTTMGALIVSDVSPWGNATFTAAIPEPSAFALLGLGTVGLLARRRRTA